MANTPPAVAIAPPPIVAQATAAQMHEASDAVGAAIRQMAGSSSSADAAHDTKEKRHREGVKAELGGSPGPPISFVARKKVMWKIVDKI